MQRYVGGDSRSEREGKEVFGSGGGVHGRLLYSALARTRWDDDRSTREQHSDEAVDEPIAHWKQRDVARRERVVIVTGRQTVGQGSRGVAGRERERDVGANTNTNNRKVPTSASANRRHGRWAATAHEEPSTKRPLWTSLYVPLRPSCIPTASLLAMLICCPSRVRRCINSTLAVIHGANKLLLIIPHPADRISASCHSF